MTSIMFRRHVCVQFIVPIKWRSAKFTHRMPHKTTSLTLTSIHVGVTCAYVLIQLGSSIQFLLTYKHLCHRNDGIKTQSIKKGLQKLTFKKYMECQNINISPSFPPNTNCTYATYDGGISDPSAALYS